MTMLLIAVFCSGVFCGLIIGGLMAGAKCEDKLRQYAAERARELKDEQ